MSPECTTSVFALTVVPPDGPSSAKIGPGGRLNVIVWAPMGVKATLSPGWIAIAAG